jgi:ankyrin repeat protein
MMSNVQRYLILILLYQWIAVVGAQTPPDSVEIAAFREPFRAVVQHDNTALRRYIDMGKPLDVRDDHGRSALHVAAFFANHDAMRKLASAGADPNALESDFYDMLTIAAVANDLDTLNLALELGNRAGNVTSRYDGTALIAAAHLGHVEIVQALISAGAPLDHINNLHWTAVIEAIVLGDGGARHTATLKALVDAGATVNIADRGGKRPLQMARERGYGEMIGLLEEAGAK